MKPELWASMYLFVTSISFALSDSLWKIPLREISSAKGIFIRNIGTTTFLGLLALLAQEENNFTAEDVFFCVFISFVSYWGLYFYVQSQKFLSLTITHRILKISAIFHFLWSIFYYREAVDCQKTILFLISLVASLLIICNPQKKDKLSQRKGVFYAILASIFWGVSYAFFKDASTRLGEARFAFILELTILCTSALLLVFNKDFSLNFQNKVSFKTYRILFLIALLGALGVFCSNLSYTAVPFSSLLIISSISDIIPIGIGLIFYKERLHILQYLGVALSLLSNWLFLFYTES